MRPTYTVELDDSELFDIVCSLHTIIDLDTRHLNQHRREASHITDPALRAANLRTRDSLKRDIERMTALYRRLENIK